MKRILFLGLAAFFLLTNSVNAATIQYLNTGKETPDMTISYSNNNGTTWQKKVLKRGQSFPIPPSTTNLNINNVPYDPKSNWKVKDGNVYK